MRRSSKDAPYNHLRAKALLAQVSGIRDIGEWQYFHPNLWALDFTVVLSKDTSSYIPKISRWFVVTSSLYPEGPIEVYPAKTGGIDTTFWHQNFNGEGFGKEWGGYEWRTGKLCLDHPQDITRASLREPFNVDERLTWQIKRTIQWCAQAQSETLVRDGHPFELPQHPSSAGEPACLVFMEDSVSYEDWNSQQCRQGFVGLRKLRSNPRFHVVDEFQDSARTSIKKVVWGDVFRELFSDELSLGLWLRLDQIPVDPPWRFPSKWEDLYSHCLAGEHNLKQLLDDHSSILRDGEPHIVMIGYPVPLNYGGPIDRIHWSGLLLPVLTNKKTRRGNKYSKQGPTRGFRNNEDGFLKIDNLRLRHPSIPVPWTASRNWASDQLTTRGTLQPEALGKRLLLIGAGALGSIVADFWTRAGGAIDTIIDNDVIEAGNLSRHTLNIRDVGRNKAEALVRLLGNINPNLNCKAVRRNLISYTQEEFAEATKSVDTIVDCTGSDEALSFLKEVRPDQEKTYISLSTGVSASRLYAFASNGVSFPLNKFRESFKTWGDIELEAIHEQGLPWEGVGCWHPVVPARVDSLGVLAGFAVKFMERAVADQPERCFEVWSSVGTRIERQEKGT